MKYMKLLEETNDNRNITLDNVGIHEMVVPATVALSKGEVSPWIVVCDFVQQLHADERGVNMTDLAQFIQNEIANQTFDHLKITAIGKLLIEFGRPLQLTLLGKVFVPVESPQSKHRGVIDCDLTYRWIVINGVLTFQQELTVPIVTSCPGSKKLAKVSAHSQRGYATLGLQDTNTTILEMFTVVKSCASSLVYPVLSGEDDASITVTAYENGKFVEDVVKDIVVEIQKYINVPYYVRSIHNESIHNHQAFAEKTHELYVQERRRNE